VAQLVFVADGMPWFKDYIVSKFPGIVEVLDNQHMLKRILDTLKLLFRKGSKKIRKLYAQLCRWVTGRRPTQNNSSAGLRATGPGSRPRTPEGQQPKSKPREYPSWDTVEAVNIGLPAHYGGAFIVELSKLPAKTKAKQKSLQSLLKYVTDRVEDVRYAEFWERGITISSAPIESFHRVAQTRLKLPGQTWTPEMAQAILNLRVLNYLGNETCFWSEPEVSSRLRTAFEERKRKRANSKKKLGV
jgi:hypothetical protein